MVRWFVAQCRSIQMLQIDAVEIAALWFRYQSPLGSSWMPAHEKVALLRNKARDSVT